MKQRVVVPEETLAAFGGDELRARIWYEKYALRGPDDEILETAPEQMWRRVAREIASAEGTPELRTEWEREFYWLLEGFRFLPGGRILHGAGNPNKVTLINCFVEQLQGDSIEAIWDAAKHAAKTYSRGGGCGVDISPLRPKDAPVHNAARVSTGAVSFMELYSLTTGLIGQSGRRGALMLTVADHHPDVLDFCRIKRDLTSVRFANISVRLSDAFMRAVERDEPWTLWFEGPETGRIERVIRASELWEELVAGARDWAEPGCLFWDRITGWGTSNYGGMQPVSTNPCLRGSSRILTRRGLVRIDSIVGQTVEIYAGDGQWRPAHVVPTGRKPIYRLLCSNGLYLEATEDHRIDADWRELALRDCLGTEVRPFVGSGNWNGEATVDQDTATLFGFIQGDGSFHSNGGVSIKFGDTDKDAVDFIVGYCNSRGIEHTLNDDDQTLYLHKPVRQALKVFGFVEMPLPDRTLPEHLFTQPPVIVRAFLKGLFSANGAVILSDTGRVALKTTCRQLAKDVQQLLFALGIASYITTNRPSRIAFANGTYETRESYDVNIPGMWARMFTDEIGFLQHEKTSKARGWRRGKYFTHKPVHVVAIESLGEDDVYDFSEPVTHWGWVNGLRVHNCGEQPLEHGGCCDLGSINLAHFVLDPFTPEARADGEGLRRAVRAAVRFLDDVHEYSLGHHLYSLPHQEEAARRGRRVGVGITGLGDMLVQLGLRYDSDAAITFAGNLMAVIKHAAYRTSVELAREKGPFPAFDADQHLAQAFFSTFPDELVAAIRSHGLRNVSVLTIPPVGSGSALAGCTNGLEPIFALSYVRRSESLSQEYFSVLHPLVAEYARARGLDLSGLQTASDPSAYLKAKLPPEFAAAHEIDPIKRVEMQAALQVHIDQSISGTVNLPRDATAETVGQIYFHAWRSGLKGISCYREGSRQGILLTPEEAKRSHALVALSEKVAAIAREVAPTLPVNSAGSPEQQIELVTRALADLVRQHPEQLQLIGEDDSLVDDRPECLSGTTYRIPTAFGTAFVNVTERDGEPYEVFARLGKAGSDAEADAEGLGRLCSVILRLRRRRGDGERLRRLQLIIEQLEGIGGSRQYGFGPNRVCSIPDAIAIALRKYLTARQEAASAEEQQATPAVKHEAESEPVAGGSNGNLCPRCLQRSLVATEGCTKCQSCGFREC